MNDMSWMMTRADTFLKKRETSSHRMREGKTIAAMLRMYCRAHHNSQGELLCPACMDLKDYARRRLERCPFGEAKPICAKCPVHCYNPAMRDAVRDAMRWAGPRMLFRYPLLTICHLINGRRPSPNPRVPN
jgi:hypothetical protein